MTMHPTLSHPQIDLLPDHGTGTDQDVRTQVWGLLTTLYPKVDVLERRREMRYPFPYLIQLTPVDQDGTPSGGESVVVVGKHISQRGLSFYHPKPLPYRRVIASLESQGGQWLGFLVDLNWCRFTKRGWYESGGRFLHAVESPLNQMQ